MRWQKIFWWGTAITVIIGSYYFITTQDIDAVFNSLGVIVILYFGLRYLRRPRYDPKIDLSVQTDLLALGWKKVDTSVMPAIPPHLLPKDILFQAIRFVAQFELIIDERVYQLTYFLFISENHYRGEKTFVPLALLTTTFSNQLGLDGWVRLRSNESYFTGLFDEVDLESVDFNSQTEMKSSNKSLAYQVFSPDLMGWYLDLKPRPWLYVNGVTCGLMFEGQPNKEQSQAIVLQLKHFLTAVQTGGALKTTSVPSSVT